MLTYFMKAAVRYPAQLDDRAARFATLGMPVGIELHTYGLADLYDRDAFAQTSLPTRESTAPTAAVIPEFRG